MIIDYAQMRKLVQLRLDQLEDASLEYEKYNQERIQLKKVIAACSECLKLERIPDEAILQNPFLGAEVQEQMQDEKVEEEV